MKPIKLPVPSSDRNYDALDPFDVRYYDTEAATYLSERSRIAYQAYVEAALALTLSEFDICSSVIARQIEQASRKVRAEDVYTEEQTTRHDIKALVNCIKKELPDNAKPFVHFGATSYDIISTASALQLRDATQKLVIPRLQSLITTLSKLATDYADTAQIGRTHGQHGVPITFGFALSGFVSRLGESMLALRDLSNQLPGKFSGAVGAYNALGLFASDPQKFERSVLEKLGLPVAPFSTQIVPAEYTIRLLDELAISAGIMSNLAHDMRNLQRTEIAEVRERFEPGQTGSSTMAHKRNPWNFENVVSMGKQVSAQMLNANLNISSEHQRDLTDSASSRFYTLAFAGVASMAERLNRILPKLEVDEAAMQRNLYLTAGAIAAEPLYLLFEKYGHIEAHEKSKSLAHKALADKRPLAEIVQKDSEGSAYWQKFSAQERKVITEPEKYYTGLAAQKATQIAKRWQKTI